MSLCTCIMNGLHIKSHSSQSCNRVQLNNPNADINVHSLCLFKFPVQLLLFVNRPRVSLASLNINSPYNNCLHARSAKTQMNQWEAPGSLETKCTSFNHKSERIYTDWLYFITSLMHRRARKHVSFFLTFI